MSDCNCSSETKKEPKNGLYLTSEDFEQWQNYFTEIYSKDKIIHSKDNRDILNESLIVQNITFVVTERCNLNCTYCFSGNTPITMYDFTKKQIKDLTIGDKILAFNEFSKGRGTHNVSEIATVEQLFNRKEKTIKMIFEDDSFLEVTKNHPILARRNTNNSKHDYKEAGKFKIGQSVYSSPNMYDIETNIEDVEYQKGYFIAMMQGDGSYKKHIDKNEYDMYKIRLAVKDEEIINRMSKIMKNLDIEYYIADFEVSKKYNITNDAIFTNTKKTYDAINTLIDNNFLKNKNINYYKGYLAGIYDAEGNISKQSNTIRICNTDKNIIKEIVNGLIEIGIPYCIENKTKTINNLQMFNVRILGNKKDKLHQLKFVMETRPAVKGKGIENFHNKSIFYRKKIKEIIEGNKIVDVFNIGTSSKTYIANNILVHNCYETHDKHQNGERMTKEVAKKAIDLIFNKEMRNGYFDEDKKKAIILDIIGGEPLLEIDLIDYITDYFKFKALELNHPWGMNYMISITSNGILYLDEKVKKYLDKNEGKVSMAITIDGNKDLHDSCRVFPNGKGSYEIVEKSVIKWIQRDNGKSTKLTLAPENIKFLNQAVKHLWKMGLPGIYSNPVFEEGWKTKDATVFYYELKELADYILENDLYKTNFISLFDETIGQLRQESQNWCGGNGEMLCFAPDGRAFPCLRFMEHSLKKQKETPVGNIHIGLDSKKENEFLKSLCQITMDSQSSGQCINCPVETGCALCTGYNYDQFGDPNVRATYICQMHQARVMVNFYYWNKLYKKIKLDKKFNLNIPKEWALKIINAKEYENLIK